MKKQIKDRKFRIIRKTVKTLFRMSAKNLIRYRNSVGGQSGNDLLSSKPPGMSWQPPVSSDSDSKHGGHVKRSSVDHSDSERSASSSSTENSNSSNRLEEDSFDEGIDDILAQVFLSFGYN